MGLLGGVEEVEEVEEEVTQEVGELSEPGGGGAYGEGTGGAKRRVARAGGHVGRVGDGAVEVEGGGGSGG